MGFTVDSWSLGFVGDKLDAVSALSSASETRISNILTQLDTLETQLNSAIAANAGIQVKTDGTVYYRDAAISQINNQYNYWKGKLSDSLGIFCIAPSSRVVRS